MKKTAMILVAAIGAYTVWNMVNAPQSVPRPHGIAFYADSGFPYVVESSTDLANWTPWTNGIGQGYSNEIYYPVAMTQPQQFFRVNTYSTNL